MAIIFQDSFTDTNGTALTSHVPDTGTGWTEEERTGTLFQEIENNRAVPGPSGGESDVRHIYSAQPNPGTSDVDVEITIVTVGGSQFSLTGPGFLVARFADTNNYYSAGVYWDGTFKIFKKVSGTVTELATFSGSIANGNTIKFELRGTTLKIYKNGTEQASATDSDLSSAGKAGFGLGNAWVSTDDIYANWELDDFTVTEVDTDNPVDDTEHLHTAQKATVTSDTDSTEHSHTVDKAGATAKVNSTVHAHTSQLATIAGETRANNTEHAHTAEKAGVGMIKVNSTEHAHSVEQARAITPVQSTEHLHTVSNVILVLKVPNVTKVEIQGSKTKAVL